MQRIAQQAGFTTGAIYWHFESKDQLFLAVFEQYALSRVGELDRAHADAPRGLPARARELADQWMLRVSEDPGMVVVTIEFFVHALRVPALREQLATRLAAVRLAVGRILDEDAREAGVELPMPAQDIATAMRELGVGLALAQLTDPDAIPPDLYGRFVETFYELVLSASKVGGARDAS